MSAALTDQLRLAAYHVTSTTPDPSKRQRQRLPRSLVSRDSIRRGRSLRLFFQVFEAYRGRLSTSTAERAASSALQECCTDRPVTFLRPAPYHVTSTTPGPSKRQGQRLPRSLGSRDSIRRGRSLRLFFQVFEAYHGRLSILTAERAASSALHECCTDRPAPFLRPAAYHVTPTTPGPSKRQRQRLS
ncbi:hypothetical protein MRX96_041241 [Rhipicephalus microplus]